LKFRLGFSELLWGLGRGFGKEGWGLGVREVWKFFLGFLVLFRQ
jgi:hypothetical protein